MKTLYFIKTLFGYALLTILVSTSSNAAAQGELDCPKDPASLVSSANLSNAQDVGRNAQEIVTDVIDAANELKPDIKRAQSIAKKIKSLYKSVRSMFSSCCGKAQ